MKSFLIFCTEDDLLAVGITVTTTKVSSSSMTTHRVGDRAVDVVF